jgi:threonine-phosphate decarboxylase
MYKHGGDVEEFALMYGYDTKDIIDLSSNINHLKPNIKLDYNSIDISVYPKYNSLKESIASFYNVTKDNITLFNGASSAIFFMINYLEYKEAFIYSPAYLEYKRALQNSDKKINLVDRFNSKEVSKNSLVIFVNPSTPDGMYYELDSMMKEWIEKGCIIFIDESFLEFVKNNKSVVGMIQEYNKLYILKSMTKIFASAGVRVGTIVSNKNNIENINKKLPPWQISALDSYYIQQAIKDKKHIKKTVDEVEKNREILVNILKKYNFISKIYPSYTNYILIKLKEENKNIIKHLAKYKIMVRDCSNFDFLDSRHIRVAIKGLDTIDILKRGLDEY